MKRLILIMMMCVMAFGCEEVNSLVTATQPLSCEPAGLTAGRAATEIADAYCHARDCVASEYAAMLLAGRDPADVLDDEYTYDFEPTTCRRDALDACVKAVTDPKVEPSESCLWIVRTPPTWITSVEPGDLIAGYDDNLSQETAPVLVDEFMSVYVDRISCGWDRCGASGGYMCSGSGVVCIWQRGTWYFQCGSVCVSGGSSCYSCQKLGMSGAG